MLKMIIVDDEYYTCEGMKKAIDWEKYSIKIVATASDGIEAIEIVKNYDIDIIITDIKMQVMDGLDMIESLRKNNFTGEILVLSGYQYFDYAKRAIDNGVRKYLVKPLDFEELEKTISLISEELLAKKPQQKYKIKQGSATEVIKEMMEYIDKNFCGDVQLSVLASKFYCDVTYLSRLFKSYTGMNYLDYLTKKRIEKAKEFLINSAMPIDEVSYKIGYQDVTHFRRVFKSHEGMSPKLYRKINNKDIFI